VTLLGRPYEKIRKSDVSILDSLKKNVSQRGLWGHVDPMAPQQGDDQVSFLLEPSI
jgi:hypothetical protein